MDAHDLARIEHYRRWLQPDWRRWLHPDWERFVRTFADQLDAVFIITPHVLHFAQATACLEAGIDVLLEKPMVMSANEATALIRTRDRSSRLVREAQRFARAAAADTSHRVAGVRARLGRRLCVNPGGRLCLLVRRSSRRRRPLDERCRGGQSQVDARFENLDPGPKRRDFAARLPQGKQCLAIALGEVAEFGQQLTKG